MECSFPEVAFDRICTNYRNPFASMQNAERIWSENIKKDLKDLIF
jgi:hypothetical protein